WACDPAAPKHRHRLRATPQRKYSVIVDSGAGSAVGQTTQKGKLRSLLSYSKQCTRKEKTTDKNKRLKALQKSPAGDRIARVYQMEGMGREGKLKRGCAHIEACIMHTTTAALSKLFSFLSPSPPLCP
ncbi:unnamed protein product, partial [Ectocarpus fasciculatus]